MHNHEEFNKEKTYFGFWVYLMTDLLMFATLFAAYSVLSGNTFGGPSARDIFSLPFALTETLILLTSSFTSGLGVLAAQQNKKTQVFIWFGITFLLGASFLAMELSEFTRLFADGNGFQRSAFLSSFFSLVGTHGLHIASGLLWMIILFAYIIRRGLTKSAVQKLTLLSLFWHFLDIVWIFIFTIVYLFGGIY
ncbi:MAG: cytochrome o ubiquinol oxidase subunit III [Patescibacteria group bacterium]|nr:cytochrome o ubiquinol oxidase subunit III [Patescibacteria group bacterium]MDE2589746.1 cytochrome o ubiquinol oxidase subunit III [Patescibacteria group bacterium]